jgi:PAS domain S-box-containing protein
MQDSSHFSNLEKHIQKLITLAESIPSSEKEKNKLLKLLDSAKNELSGLHSKFDHIEFYQKIYNLSPVGVFVINKDGLYQEVNNAACDQTGYNREELLQMNAKELGDTDNISSGRNHFQELLESGASKGEVDIKRKDGSRICMEIDALQLSENLYIGFTKDISKQKKYESDLRVSNERHKILSEIAEEGVFIHDKGKIIEVNMALCKLLGYEYQEMIGIDGYELITEESYKRLMDAIAAGYTQPIEVEMLHKEGHRIIAETFGKSYEVAGKTLRVVIVYDISEKKRQELALRESADQLAEASFIFNNMQSGMYIYHLEDLDDDRTLRMVAANPSSAALTGVAVKDVVGKTLDENFPGLRERGIPQKYAEVIRTGIPHAFEDITYRDERVIKGAFAVKAFPLPNDHIGVSFENVIKRKMAEQELKTRNLELNNFVYKVSHDLRAPLSSIKGLIHLSKLEKGTDEYIARIEESVEKLDGFIRNVLSHSRNLNTVPIRDKINFKKKIGQCFHELDYLPGSNSIKKIIKIDNTPFYNDSVRIFEVFRNLISNSIKYRDNEKSEQFVRIEITVNDKSAFIILEDNGIGISSEHLSRIFDMFYRAHEISDGSGIGLYIVNQAVNKLNGTIAVSSKKDIGTRFEIELPNMINE